MTFLPVRREVFVFSFRHAMKKHFAVVPEIQFSVPLRTADQAINKINSKKRGQSPVLFK